MARAKIIQTNFTGGEISSAAYARSDLERWYSSAEWIENYVVRVIGGAYRRPGFAYLGRSRTPTKKGQLIRFKKSSFDQLMLEFGEFYIRFWDVATQTLIQSGGAPYEVVTPFTENDLAGIRFWQVGDVLFMANTSSAIQTKRLKRLADDNWVFGDYEYREGPWRPESEAKVNMTPGADVGTGISLQTSGAFFDPKHVGALIRVRQNRGSPPYNKWLQKEAYTLGDLVVNAGRVYKAGSTGSSGTNSPIHDEGTESDGAMDWEFIHDGAGVVKITSVIDAQNALGDVLVRLPVSAATKYWSEGAFSDYRGHPRCGAVHQERMGLYGTASRPDTLSMSVVGDFDLDGANYKPGLGTGLITDEDAVTRTLADGEVEPIVWAISRDQLYLGTTGDVKRVSGPSLDEPITPAGASANSALSPGVSPFCRPARLTDAILYANRDGRRVLEMQFDNGERNDLTVLAEHMGASPFVDLVWAELPDFVLWGLNADGGLKSVTRNIKQGVVAWARHTIGGQFEGGPPVVESISTVFGPSGRDELWALIKRTINGVETRSIERMTRPFDNDFMTPDLACLVDSAGFFDGWNADKAKTMTLGVPGNSAPGDTGTLTATGHSPFGAAAIGKEVHLRQVNRPERSNDVPGPVRVKITASSGATVASVEFLSDVPAAVFGVALSQWGFASTVINNLDWLEGETVTGLVDGAQIDPVVVSGGSITLSDPSVRGWIGLAYQSLIRALPMEGVSNLGSARGAIKRIDAMTVIVKDALGGRIRDAKHDLSVPLMTRTRDDILGRPPTPKREAIEIDYPGNWDEQSRPEIINDDALPCTVLGFNYKATVND
ncbi:MAG: hypothetical protein COA84_07560 [Robiginitomaculum sp.]|nr:MAG: hypothetical protein COA84_07560 [Robiginitomaculum sp.]